MFRRASEPCIIIIVIVASITRLACLLELWLKKLTVRVSGVHLSPMRIGDDEATQ